MPDPSDLASRLRRAAGCVKSAGVLAYPTEAVFGLGCDPRDSAAVRRVITLKGRTAEKGLILVAAHWHQVEPFIRPLSAQTRSLIEPTWPGPNTWIVPARRNLSELLTGGSGRIAIRITALPILRDLCEACATALVSTSANPTGLAPARDAATVARYFPSGIDYTLDAPVGGDSQPSRLFDAESGERLR